MALVVWLELAVNRRDQLNAALSQAASSSSAQQDNQPHSQHPSSSSHDNSWEFLDPQ